MEPVLYEKRERIAHVTLNRPDALNALDDRLDEALWEVWADFARDPGVEVAIVTGAGKAFCAGADLKTLLPRWENATPRDVRRDLARGLAGGITRGQHRIPKPIIAAVNGHAVGGGFELALACDIRIASDQARFGVFEIRQGLHPADGGLVRLRAIAGLAVALDLALTGREVLAAEALRLGLVSQVVPHDQLLSAADACARTILANGQEAVRSAKETLLDVVGRPLDDALRLEALNGRSSVNFADVRERVARFFRKGRDRP